jgi:hypothetical protein
VGELDGVLEDLVLERLLAEQALKLTDLCFELLHLGLGHHAFARAKASERALLLEPAPTKHEARPDAVLPRDGGGPRRLGSGPRGPPPMRSTSGPGRRAPAACSPAALLT